jgi:excinuclease UvrABC nuclease subunit
VTVLALSDMRLLPEEVGDYDSGLYFLWNKDALLYIGKAAQIVYRLYRHQRANKYQAVRTGCWEKRIPFDRYTCLVVSSELEITDRLRSALLEMESAYIARYQPPFNISEGGGS